MLKTPAPAPDSVPVCFGDRFLEPDPRCRACGVRAVCAKRTAALNRHRSLAERLAEAAPKPDRPESFALTYARVYRETFGRPWRESRGAERVFDRCVEVCRAHGIDHETYIAGNMWALQPWVKNNPRIGFQPTHLSGEKAWRRYHAYVRHLERRLRHAKHGVLTGRTDAARVRDALYVGELSVAEEYVSRFVSGSKCPWSEAIESADPNVTWRSAQPYLTGGGRTDEFHRISALFGRNELVHELEYATLRAAVYLAETYQTGLSTRVGFMRFDWTSFARLVRRITRVKPESEALDLASVKGVTWP